MASRCSRALLLLLVLVSPLWAVEDNTRRGEIGITQNAEEVCRAGLFELDPSIFTVTGSVEQFPSVCTVTTATDVTLLGQCIGDVSTDFCDPVLFDGRQVDFGAATSVELPNATTCAATCTVGDVCVDSNGDSYQKLFLCESTNTFVQQGDVSSDGRSGGQTVIGGTASGEDLSLQSTAHSTRGQVNVIDELALRPTVANNTNATVASWTPAFTVDSGIVAVVGIDLSPTVSLGANTAYLSTLLRSNATYTLSAASAVSNSATLFQSTQTANFGANTAGTWSSTIFDDATVLNANNAAAGTLGGTAVRSYVARPTIKETGASGSITATLVDLFATAPILTTNNAAGAATITTLRHFAATATAMSGAGTETLTNEYGVYVGAVTSATNYYPFAAAEGTITGSATSGEGSWGVESGSPNRFFFKNESGHIWRTGWLTMTGVGTGLATTATTKYFPVSYSAASTTTANGTDVDQASPGAIKVYGMTCGLTAAAGGGTDAHAITLMDDTATTTITCTITTTASTCNVRVEAGVAIAAPSLIVLRDVTTDTPAANDITCTLVYNLDAW